MRFISHPVHGDVFRAERQTPVCGAPACGRLWAGCFTCAVSGVPTRLWEARLSDRTEEDTEAQRSRLSPGRSDPKASPHSGSPPTWGPGGGVARKLGSRAAEFF